jgi:hypothetical protein
MLTRVRAASRSHAATGGVQEPPINPNLFSFFGTDLASMGLGPEALISSVAGVR